MISDAICRVTVNGIKISSCAASEIFQNSEFYYRFQFFPVNKICSSLLCIYHSELKEPSSMGAVHDRFSQFFSAP